MALIETLEYYSSKQTKNSQSNQTLRNRVSELNPMTPTCNELPPPPLIRDSTFWSPTTYLFLGLKDSTSPSSFDSTKQCSSPPSAKVKIKKKIQKGKRRRPHEKAKNALPIITLPLGNFTIATNHPIPGNLDKPITDSPARRCQEAAYPSTPPSSLGSPFSVPECERNQPPE